MPRPRSRAGPGSGRRCAGPRRRSSSSTASPPRAPTRSATTPPGSTARRRSVTAAHQPRPRRTWRRRADVGFLNVAALAGAARGAQLVRRPRLVHGQDALCAGRRCRCSRATPRRCSRRGSACRGAALVLDLDNTLWGGVIGDDGLEGITLGGGTAGEAYVDFQVALKELAGRGIVLAVCSKNDPEVALEPFREHPEMVLKEEDIAAFVAELGAEVGRHPQHRRDPRPRARQPRLPRRQPLRARRGAPRPARGRRAGAARGSDRLPPRARGLPYFEPATFTAADRDRGRQYRARAQAIELHGAAGSLAEYQASLGMQAEFGAIDRGQPRPRRAADQQDQPVQPDHPAAQPGRARGLPRPTRGAAASGCGWPTASPITG